MWEAVRLYRQVRFVCMGRPDGNQRQSDGTDGWHAIRGNQRQSIRPVDMRGLMAACNCMPCQRDISECTRSHLIASDCL
jgi:hypothetical protein